MYLDKLDFSKYNSKFLKGKSMIAFYPLCRESQLGYHSMVNFV